MTQSAESVVYHLSKAPVHVRSLARNGKLRKWDGFINKAAQDIGVVTLMSNSTPDVYRAFKDDDDSDTTTMAMVVDVRSAIDLRLDQFDGKRLSELMRRVFARECNNRAFTLERTDAVRSDFIHNTRRVAFSDTNAGPYQPRMLLLYQIYVEGRDDPVVE